MSSPLATERLTTAFDVLADPRRRYLLSILDERSEPIALDALATELAVRERGSPVVTDEQVRTVTIELVHNHVPRLVDAGVVTDDDGDGDDDPRTIGLADHPLVEADWVGALLENPTGGPGVDESTLDRTIEVLRPARRRIACAALAQRRDPVPVADLAAMVVARTDDVRLVDVTAADREPVETRLAHDDLRALADAGLVEYDRSSATAELAADAEQWHADWLAASPLGEITDALVGGRNRIRTVDAGPAASEADSEGGEPTRDTGRCWTLEGRESVIARGHEIADAAEEELFVTVPDAGLLQDRCLDRWRAAADRGVDIYVGSQSTEVQNVVRSVIPEATVCEPRFDWLNFPVDGFHHGRVVCADRETVMLATVDDSVPGEDPRVTAISGHGRENTLVVLVREHIGPRLDRLQSHCDEATDPEEATPLPL